MDKRAIVLSNGTIDDPALLRRRLAGWGHAAVIAADAGLRHAGPLGLAADLVVGDFDSLDAGRRAGLEAAGVEVHPLPPAKDETDLELALLEAVARGAEQIVVLGAIGGRLDMTLANLLLLTHPRLAGVRVEVWHDAQTAWLIRPPGEDVSGQPGDTLSLIPLGGDAHGVTTTAMAYPLIDEVLAYGPARGVSNVLTDARAHVALRAGLLLAVHTPGRA